MNSGVNDQAKVQQLAAFRDHGWRQFVVYPSWPHVLITKLFQPSHNCAIPTVKERSKGFWPTISTNSSKTLLAFAWWITALQLLKQSVNGRSAKRFRKMLNNSFPKRSWWVRHPVNRLISWKPSNPALWKHLSSRQERTLIPIRIHYNCHEYFPF